MTLPPDTDIGALHALAGIHGVAVSSADASQSASAAEPEVLCAVLSALGMPVGRPADAPDALAADRAVRRAPVIEPVLVHRIGRPRPFRISLPRGVHPRDGRIALEMEDGTVRADRLLTAISRPIGGVVVDGQRVDGYELRLGASAPFDIPPGYHRLVLEAPGISLSSLLVSAPRCPQPERGWGAFLPLHALRTDEDRGVGSYTDLASLASWIGSLGGSLAGTLPTYPAFLEGVVEPSPYRPVTRLGWSELFIDPTALPELELAPEARDLLESRELRDRIAGAHRAVLVDHAAVMRTLRQVLEPMARALYRTPSPRRDQLEAFRAARPEMAAYAQFRATTADGDDRGSHHRGETAAAVDEDTARYHLYAQWVAEEQLSAAGARTAGNRAAARREGAVADAGGEHSGGSRAGLFLDLPLGVHPLGFDPWWEPDAYAHGISTGAPPDAFFAGGQDWAVPPMHPDHIREQEYRHPIAILRHAMAHATVLRVDHVMGLHRLYWVPDGFDPRHGVYVRYPAEELRAIVSLEAHRAGVAVVGEDLGTVPDEVRADMVRDGMLRSWVVRFESSAAEPLPEAPPGAMASWGTHDLPRFAAFWEGSDLAERAGRGDITPDELDAERAARAAWRQAVVAALDLDADRAGGEVSPPASPSVVLGEVLTRLAEGPARLVMVDLEDLWLERRPQNRPGTGAEAANWRRRAARTLAEAAADQRVADALGRIDGARRAGPRPAASTSARSDAQPDSQASPETAEQAAPGRRQGRHHRSRWGHR